LCGNNLASYDEIRSSTDYYGAGARARPSRSAWSACSLLPLSDAKDARNPRHRDHFVHRGCFGVIRGLKPPSGGRSPGHHPPSITHHPSPRPSAPLPGPTARLIPAQAGGLGVGRNTPQALKARLILKPLIHVIRCRHPAATPLTPPPPIVRFARSVRSVRSVRPPLFN